MIIYQFKEQENTLVMIKIQVYDTCLKSTYIEEGYKLKLLPLLHLSK